MIAKRKTRTLYEKKGKKFVPVGTDDIVLPYEFGDYIVRVRKGSRAVHRRAKKITADYAKLEVLMAEASDAIATAITRVSEAELPRKNTKREQRAFEAYKRIAGRESLTLSRRSSSAIANRAVLILGRRIRDEACPEGCAEVFADRTEMLKGDW